MDVGRQDMPQLHLDRVGNGISRRCTRGQNPRWPQKGKAVQLYLCRGSFPTERAVVHLADASRRQDTVSLGIAVVVDPEVTGVAAHHVLIGRPPDLQTE